MSAVSESGPRSGCPCCSCRSETPDPLRLPAGALIPAVGITCLILVLLTLG
jgi:hypothetical protein